MKAGARNVAALYIELEISPKILLGALKLGRFRFPLNMSICFLWLFQYSPKAFLNLKFSVSEFSVEEVSFPVVYKRNIYLNDSSDATVEGSKSNMILMRRPY